MDRLFSASEPRPTATQPRSNKKRRLRIHLKNAAEIALMRQAGAIAARVLTDISQMAQPGITTWELDQFAEQRLRTLGAVPSFKGYYGFPASICTCINEEVVHGIPRRRQKLRSGDLLKVDIGANFQGYHGDSCITLGIGSLSPAAHKLMTVAEGALSAGIAQVKPGHWLMDIAGAIEDYVKPTGYSIVEEYTGHGVGQNLHEPPHVFNVRCQDLPNVKLEPGMTLAIEPIINAGSRLTKTLRDRWTVVTVDKALSAQFEHTVLVTQSGCELLTNRLSSS